MSALPASHKFVHKFLFLFVLLVLQSMFSTSVLQAQSPLLRINAGSLEEASSDGVTFIGDTFYSESVVGPTLSRSIANTENDGLYQTERLTNDEGDPLIYNIPVPQTGTYTVILHFAETAFDEIGERVFDVFMEDVMVLNDYDILFNAGNTNTARIESISGIFVSDDSLTIEFSPEVERAKVNGIEILGIASTVNAPFYLNVGGFEYISDSETWTEDDGAYFLEGTDLTVGIPIEGTEDDALYTSERFGTTMRFLLPGVQPGRYSVELHFSENFHTSTGQRIFDASVEGEVVLNDFDIFAEANGGTTALVQTFDDVDVTDGILNITLVSSQGSATINAIALTNPSLVSIEDGSIVPEEYRLTAAYPNPFNPSTQFGLVMTESQNVSIHVYNLLGQRVATLHEGYLASQNEHMFTFEASSLPSGIYFIQVMGEQLTKTQQVVLLK